MYVLNVRPLYHIPRDVLVSFELGIPFSSVMYCPLMMCLPRLTCSVRFRYVPSINDVQSALIDVWSSSVEICPLMVRLSWLKHCSVQLWFVPTVMCPWLDCYIVLPSSVTLCPVHDLPDLIVILFPFSPVIIYPFEICLCLTDVLFRSIPLYSVQWWYVWPDW